MITEISLQNVACYKSRVSLPIRKEVTLLYGLNGVGKTTFSNFLYNPSDGHYSSCELKKSEEVDILVYNQRFIEDFFFEDNALKGVFTLSKENKGIKVQIEQEENQEKEKKRELQRKKNALTECSNTYNNIRTGAVDKVWEIKTTYAGGDRVLEYCIKGLMKKEKLYENLKSIKIPDNSISDTIESLKNRAAALVDENAKTISTIEKISFKTLNPDENELLSKQITSSAEGPIAEFIETLGNSDWVNEGLSFIKNERNNLQRCPFCQQETLTSELLSSIKSVFDGKYKEDLDTLGKCLENYQRNIDAINLNNINQSYFTNEEVKIWAITSKAILSTLNENVKKIENKIEHPQEKTTLKTISQEINSLNDIITKANNRIVEYNKSIANRDKSLADVKNKFWELMRKNYDQTIEGDKRAEKNYVTQKSSLEKEISIIEAEILAIQSKLINLRKKTVNIDASVDAINLRLSDLGISGFKIEKFDDTMYCLARDGKKNNIFRSLSEGEKTLISFLYFIERCHGVFEPTKSVGTKSVIIDDPISSLSHIYIFNIGQYIKKEFINNPVYSQVIVLTHSLYFFYELTFTKKEDRDQKQELYRLVKTPQGTEIKSMRYEEIQNDYQTYWSTIKDPNQQPALIANCMRNIIEHFFAFVRKRDFNNVFQLPELADDKFKSFNRYMNRESHSLGQNIFDIKEFDYDHFIEGLKLVFEKCGYGDHYKAMMK